MAPRKPSLPLAVLVASTVASIMDSPGAYAQPITGFYQSQTSLVVPYVDGKLNYRNDGEATFRNQAATVNISVAKSKPVKVTLDTGSTGIAISRSKLPSNALNGLTSLGPGAINYDSSGVTPTGTFYQLPIDIFGKNSVTGEHAVGTTSVKVLVVDSDTTYMGIGNNRNNVYRGTFNPAMTFKQNVAAGNIVQTSAIGMNPLINVAINDKALPHQGYVVMNDQVVIGLTTQNNSYSFIKLTPDTANGPQMWGTIPMTISPFPGSSNGPAIGDLLPYLFRGRDSPPRT